MQTSLTGWLKKPPAPTYASVLRHETSADGKFESPPLKHAPGSDTAAKAVEAQRSEEKPNLTSPSPAPIPYGPGPHPNIMFVQATPDRINEYKRINSLLLPVPYGRTFYDEIIHDELTNSITLLAVWTDEAAASAVLQQVRDAHRAHTRSGTTSREDSTNQERKDKVIGGIRCRLLAPYEVDTSLISPSAAIQAQGMDKILYVSSIGVLAPYRNLGIANQLLSRIEAFAAHRYGVHRMGAHVWEANTDAREWYARRGFREVKRLPDYYRKLDPASAFVLVREVRRELPLAEQQA